MRSTLRLHSHLGLKDIELVAGWEFTPIVLVFYSVSQADGEVCPAIMLFTNIAWFSSLRFSGFIGSLKM